MGLVLAVDTALGQTGIALMDEDGLRAADHHTVREQQASRLVPWVEAVLAQAQTDYTALSGIVCSVGPGGFTAIRIGLAAMRGIGFAAAVPVHGYTSLQVMAWGREGPPERCAAVLPAGRHACFLQQFDASAQPEGEARMIERAALAEVLPEGVTVVSTLEDLPVRTLPHDISRNAEYLARMALAGVEPLSPVPLYIKPPDAVPGVPLIERLQALD